MRWIVVGLLVAGGAAVLYAQKKTVDYQARFEDYGQLSRYREANAALPSSEFGRVVFFGDSITDAWPLTTGFPGKPYVNRGISGQTTPQMLVRFRQDVIELHPDAVVILAGTNDIAGNTGPETDEQVEGHLASMAELAKAHGIKVILASILPVAAYSWKPEVKPADRIRHINAWVGDFCDANGFVYLDYYGALVDPATGGMKAGTSKDGVHPTGNGYALMAPLAAAAIASLE